MKNGDKPAFPNKLYGDPYDGISIRDYFAAKAMQATDLEIYADRFGLDWSINVATDSYELADAMLKAREL